MRTRCSGHYGLCSETNEEHDGERTFHISCQMRQESGLREIHFLPAHVPNVSPQISHLRQFETLTTVNYSNGQIESQLLF